MKKEVTPSPNDAIHVTGSQTSAEAVRPPSQLRFVTRGAIDNDTNPLNQASFDLDNLVAVAATTRADQIADWSSCGATTVDLGAPGEEIFSCARPLNLQTALLSTNGITSNSANGPVLSSPAATTDMK